LLCGSGSSNPPFISREATTARRATTPRQAVVRTAKGNHQKVIGLLRGGAEGFPEPAITGERERREDPTGINLQLIVPQGRLAAKPAI
jgi:hypothetical protein